MNRERVGEYREPCVSLGEVKGGSVGLKCSACLKLYPPCNPHLVTAACDTVLKSKPFFQFAAHYFVYAVSCHPPSSPPMLL